jgi:hypothetical protein
MAGAQFGIRIILFSDTAIRLVQDDGIEIENILAG